MLDTVSTTTFAVPPAPPVPPRKVSGQYLAKNKLDARGRAKLAADLIDGRAALGPLTAKQVTGLCRASSATVAKVRGVTHHRAMPADNSETLAEHFARTTPAEWTEAARAIGAANVWDFMIAPLV
jgi:hypothetical protein